MNPHDISGLLRHVLPPRHLGLPVHHYESIDSTMIEAARLADAGVSSGTMVLAEMQTQGRGRLGRAWHSDSSAGIYFTLVLRPNLEPAAAPVLTLMAGVSLATVMEAITPGRVDLRWPNDLLINGRKCAGILVEMRADPRRIDHVLLGIGINVNQTEFPGGLETEPSSLQLETGRPVQRADLLISLLKQLDADYNHLLSEGPARVLRCFEAISSYARGKRVRVGDHEPYVLGTTAGLTPEGLLLVAVEDGRIEKVVAGHVRPLE